MATNLSGVLASVPGLAGYLAKQQFDQQQEMGQVQQMGALAQLQAQMQNQQRASQAQAREQEFRSALAGLGPNPSSEQLAQVAARYGTPDAIMKAQQSSADRAAQREAAIAQHRAMREQRMEELNARLAQQATTEAERNQLRRELAQMQIDSRRDLMGLAASLRPAPQPRNLQLTTDAEGNQLIVNPDGTTTPLQAPGGIGGVKKPVGTDKPMTEFQGKAALYGTRAAQSDKVLKGLEDKISTAGLAMGQSTGVVGNFLMSSEQRRVDQAQRDFVNAVLRQESGAVISDAEFANAKKQYFPQPGDDPNVVAQKRANRELAIKGFARMSGPKGAADIDAIIREPLLPGVAATNPTPQQAGGQIKPQAPSVPPPPAGFVVNK